MGRAIPTDYDEELIVKLRILFEQAAEKLSSDNNVKNLFNTRIFSYIYFKILIQNPDGVLTFEEFVKELDVNDKTVKRIFEFLVKVNLFFFSPTPNKNSN